MTFCRSGLSSRSGLMLLPHKGVRWGSSRCASARSKGRSDDIVMILTTSRQGRLSAWLGGTYDLAGNPYAALARAGSAQNASPLDHIACRMTASFRATATTAFLCPFLAFKPRPQRFRAESDLERVST